MITLDLALGALGLLLTLMVFSYLAGDKLLFRIAMALLVGVGAGYAALVLIQKLILPYLVLPLFTPAGLPFYLSLAALLLILLLGFSFIPSLRPLAKIPLSLILGLLSALAIFGLARGTLAPQLLAVVNRFSPSLLSNDPLPDWLAILRAAAMLLGVIAVLLTFDHHRRVAQPGRAQASLAESTSGIGQVFIGISFGAIFAAVFATALIALIGRLTWIYDLVLRWMGA